jgi:hypothetical protein
MTKSILILSMSSAILALSGCTSFSPRDVAPNPSSITVASALDDIGQGLRKLREAAGEKPFGFQACDMTVTLALTADAKDSTKLVVDTSVKADVVIPATSPVTPSGNVGGSIGINSERAASSAAIRANTVTLRLVNVACIPKGLLAADNAKEYFGAIKDPTLNPNPFGPRPN